MKYAELFAGVGGFRLGIKQALPEAQCVYANEWDKYAAAVYRHRFGGITEGDIREQSTNDIPDFDFLTAGFPCQTFSVAGKRAGFDDTRGTLFFEVARFLRDKRPGHFLLENVKGLLSSQGGKDFQVILGVLADIGYRVEWEVLNSTVWVPQNRERVFIVGHSRNECAGQVFPLREDDGIYPEAPGESKPENVPVVVERPHGYNQSVIKAGICLRGEGHSEQNQFVGVLQKTSGQTVTLKNNETGCLQAGGDNVRDKVPNVVSGNHRFRRLTPVECERLQAFPNGWTQTGLFQDGKERPISDTQRYRMMGNAVTTSVVREIVKKMIHGGCL